jgi:Transposase IS200 like
MAGENRKFDSCGNVHEVSMPNARCDFLGHKFWARGYFVTTVGRDEEVIRAYIRNQELADQQLGAEDLSRPKIQSIVLTSLKTAFGGSQSNLQLCWRLLAHFRICSVCNMFQA